MTHLPYITAAYALGTLIPVTYAFAAWTRARTAARRLAAVETR